MIEISKVEIQDTPIKSLLVMWWEGQTLHSVEIPVAWFLLENGFVNVSDGFISMYGDRLIKDIFESPNQWIEHIKDDDEWGNQISSIDCSVEEIPECFQQ